jgi:outer membrane lipoprotein-sorting protein
MLRRLAPAAALLIAFAATGRAQTADEIVAKTIAAQGGADKIKAIQSMKMTGTMSLPNVGDVPVTIQAKRPKKVRVDLEIQGTQNSQGYDGETGWLFLPIQGMKAAQPAPSDMMKDLDEQADMDGPIVDYKAKGNTIELIGKEAVQGTDAYKLKVTTKAGDVRYVYVDAEHFLPLKSESKRTINGAERSTSTMLGDYKQVAGVMMPHSIESSIEGVPVTQKVSIQKIEVNVPIDDASFKMPVAK